MLNNKLLATLASASLLSLALPSLAYTNSSSGLYVGGQLGYGKTHYGYSKGSGVHEDGTAGRVYIGYQASPFIGAEIGGVLFSDVDLPKDLGCFSTKQLDLLMKIGTPFGDSNLRGDIKAGIAGVRSDYEKGSRSRHPSRNNTQTVAVMGASLSYNVNRQLAFDVSFLHDFGNIHDNVDFSPRTDLLTLGVSYQFIQY